MLSAEIPACPVFWGRDEEEKNGKRGEREAIESITVDPVERERERTTRTVRLDHPLDSISAVFLFLFFLFFLFAFLFFSFFRDYPIFLFGIIPLFSTPPSKDRDQQALSGEVNHSHSERTSINEHFPIRTRPRLQGQVQEKSSQRILVCVTGR